MIEMLKTELVQSVQEVASGIAGVVPSLVAALLFIIVGWVFGSAVGRVIQQLVDSAKADEWLGKAGVDKFLEKAGYKLNSGAFLGWLAKLFFIIVFLIAALDILGLSQVNVFLTQVLAYIPQVIIATIVLFVASVAADLLGSAVTGTTHAVGGSVARLLGSVTRWSIWIFAFMVALSQLGVAAQYMNILFTGIVAMLALAGGLAFGLGGKDAAGDFIKKVQEEIK
jgi:small-conductance mechanosensitive channel